MIEVGVYATIAICMVVSFTISLGASHEKRGPETGVGTDRSIFNHLFRRHLICSCTDLACPSRIQHGFDGKL
jgi:hypothetical protein